VCCFHAGAVIELIQERDYVPAMKILKYGHHFRGESVGVVHCNVMFNFIGASPLEIAERASARRFVSILQMPI
jgi:hypothetical protein